MLATTWKAKPPMNTGVIIIWPLTVCDQWRWHSFIYCNVTMNMMPKIIWYSLPYQFYWWYSFLSRAWGFFSVLFMIFFCMYRLWLYFCYNISLCLLREGISHFSINWHDERFFSSSNIWSADTNLDLIIQNPILNYYSEKMIGPDNGI